MNLAEANSKLKVEQIPKQGKAKGIRKAQYNRSEDEAIGLLWMPSWGICPDFRQRRNAAILEVARRLPNDATETLEAKAESFWWFIPHERMLARVLPFVITHEEAEEEFGTAKYIIGRYSKVLYLGPILEKISFDIVVVIVAHELAHIFLDHPMTGVPQPTYWVNEEATWQLVDSWGFDQEAKKEEQFHKQWE
jgi:hypothetical protein